jgi:hypothetical protein
MATIKAVSSKAPLGKVVDYVNKDEKTEERLKSGINCEPETAFDEMQSTKAMWNKQGGREYMHFVQSFKPGETTPEQAQAIGKELAENNGAWKGFEVLVVTHKDREHIHNHFVVNSVSFEDGHKLQSSKKDLENLKQLSDKICEREHLSVIDRSKPRERENVTAYKKDTYKILKDAELGATDSYVQNIAAAIVEVKSKATSQEEFIKAMNDKGYDVDWQEAHKHITFTDRDRELHGEKKCKVRNSRLEKYYNIDFSKEGLLNDFETNRARATERTAEEPRLSENVQRAKATVQPTNDRIDGMQEKLEQIERARTEDRESFLRGSNGVGNTPEREPVTETADRKLRESVEPITEQSTAVQQLRADLERARAEQQERIRKAGEEQQTIRAEVQDTARDSTEVLKGYGDVKAQQLNIREGQQTIKGKQRELGTEQQGIAESIERADGVQRDIKGEQQSIHREQRRISESQRGIMDRVRELGERVKETIERVFKGHIR